MWFEKNYSMYLLINNGERIYKWRFTIIRNQIYCQIPSALQESSLVSYHYQFQEFCQWHASVLSILLTGLIPFHKIFLSCWMPWPLTHFTQITWQLFMSCDNSFCGSCDKFSAAHISKFLQQIYHSSDFDTISYDHKVAILTGLNCTLKIIKYLLTTTRSCLITIWNRFKTTSCGCQ